jgi:pyruvate formate lyase activating enzyme
MRCIGVAKCGKCLAACAKGAVSLGEVTQHAATHEDIQLIRIDRSICDNCGDCATACHPNALYLCGEDYTVEDLVKRVARDIPFYNRSGGGVTISGGEPLSQTRFTLKVLQGLRELGIHTALDTTGFTPYENIEAVLPYTDLFLYDLKHMDSRQHKTVVGVPNEIILENARKIAQAGGKLQIRIPVIPRFNDSEENIRATGVFCKSLGEAVTVIQLLPYHNLGVMKYRRIDDDRVLLEATPPSDDKMQGLKTLLDDMGLNVTIH